jgi:hypothetical protein
MMSGNCNYEFAVMSELKNALRGGDVWVSRNRQFKGFDDICCRATTSIAATAKGLLGLPVPTSAKAYRNGRLAALT